MLIKAAEDKAAAAEDEAAEDEAAVEDELFCFLLLPCEHDMDKKQITRKLVNFFEQV